MSEPLLRARKAGLSYSADLPPAVSDVDLEILPGEAVGIVGESGSGKTSLARILVGMRPPTSGAVEVGGRSWADVKGTDPLRRTVQMIFQDPFAALNPWMTARQMVAEVIQHWDGVNRQEASTRAAAILGEAGLASEAMDRKPGELSGGQCQRIGIARALACEPAVLIADEPTSALDVSVQAQILNLLVSLRASRNLAIVLISHDLSVVRYLTDRTLVMYRTRVVESGPTARLMDHPEHAYTKGLIGALPGRRLDRPVDGEPRDTGT